MYLSKQFLCQTIVNSSKQFLCQTSQNKSITNFVSVNLTPDNDFNTMHSITKVLSSMATIINEEFGLTMQVHGSFLMDNSHCLIILIVLLQIYTQFRFIKYSTNLCFTIFFLNQLKLLSSNNYHIYIWFKHTEMLKFFKSLFKD